MLGRLKFLVLYFLSWVIFFEAARLVFLLYHFSQTRQLSFSTAALSFFYGLRMDISMASYLLLPVCLFVLASFGISYFRKPSVYKIYSCIVLFFILFIIMADLELYSQWGFRIDATPLRYLASPKEAWASISNLPLFWIFLGFLVVFASMCLLLIKLINKLSPLLLKNDYPLRGVLLILPLTLLLVIPMRGGLQLTPLNQSSVYFSKDNFANIAAINATWNFVHGITNHSTTRNPYQYLNTDRARQITDSLYQHKNNIEKVLNTDQPNVIVVVWESFTEKATHAQLEGKPVTPGFNELKKEGIYFNQAYASGDRTDKGLAAVLSGYPALNNVSIIRFPAKSAKLNSLGSYFKSKGYQTSFYYGGEPEFANIKSFILQSGYDNLVEKSDFASKDLNSKWGAHDGVVASRMLQDLDKLKQPFFSTWLTLTSHEPFETPVPAVFQGKDRTTLFLNALHYTDGVLYQLVQDCKKQPWWKNTVMIIVADHGHPLPEPNDLYNNFKIPVLWLGGALQKKGVEINRICSQLDIATSLTMQTGANTDLFPFSKNIFDSSSHPWAYYSFNNGFGFVQPDGSFVFDNVGKQVVISHGPVSDRDLQAGKAMQQAVFDDYLHK